MIAVVAAQVLACSSRHSFHPLARWLQWRGAVLSHTFCYFGNLWVYGPVGPQAELSEAISEAERFLFCLRPLGRLRFVGLGVIVQHPPIVQFTHSYHVDVL